MILDTLEFPLVMVDVESTGAWPEVDRIVSIAFVKRYPDGRLTEWESLVNPGVPIPPESTAIHGITNEMVAQAPSFRDIAHHVVNGTRDCYIGGYNAEKFDLKIILAELKRAGVPLGRGVLDGQVIDVFRLFQRFAPRNLSAAVRHYLGEELEGAHSALVDVKATWRVFERQCQLHHADIPPSLPELIQWLSVTPDSNNVDSNGTLVWRFGVPYFNFGKHQGRSLQEVCRAHADYIRWMLRSDDFTAELKDIVKKALNGDIPRRNTSGS